MKSLKFIHAQKKFNNKKIIIGCDIASDKPSKTVLGTWMRKNGIYYLVDFKDISK